MKVSIVTPCFNSGKHVGETFESVIRQKGDFELEYVIVDGGSTDGTLDIIKEYAEKCSIKWISEPDQGMYDALNKGFSMVTGEILAWINSDDIYYPGALERAIQIFKKHENIYWITGNSKTIGEDSEIIYQDECRFYNRAWLKKGHYGAIAAFVEQESVFFRKSLWNKVGNFDLKYKLAGDYWLWYQFAKITDLYSFDYLTSAFRRRKGQLSGDFEKYMEEVRAIGGDAAFNNYFLRMFTKYEGHFPKFVANTFFQLFFRKSSKLINENNKVRKTYNFKK